MDLVNFPTTEQIFRQKSRVGSGRPPYPLSISATVLNHRPSACDAESRISYTTEPTMASVEIGITFDDCNSYHHLIVVLRPVVVGVDDLLRLQARHEAPAGAREEMV